MTKAPVFRVISFALAAARLKAISALATLGESCTIEPPTRGFSALYSVLRCTNTHYRFSASPTEVFSNGIQRLNRPKQSNDRGCVESNTQGNL